ncbi:MAG: transcriptional repressor [Clostridia bacterium]|nr:transcriptional repressor [Clostridia bacterium]
MNKYSTKQRKILLDFLSLHTDEQLSAKDIASELADKNISLSAVYRNISQLESEGVLKRFSKQGSRNIYYQYTGSKCCRNLLHLSCKNCGKTFHMEDSGTSRLINEVEKTNGFKLDKTSTVLYGLCAECVK